jgi:CheY-like chemotaxis protein/tRNA A-37 threonylcarbamoyl transferase component Bud32
MSMKHAVLIVDDDPVILMSLKAILEQLDCEILTATNGQEALTVIIEAFPSLVITDWQMPVLDGLGLFLQLKNSPHTAHIPVVFLTSMEDDDVKAAFLEMGIEDYWKKPFNVREVQVRVKRLLERLNAPEKVRQSGFHRIPVETPEPASEQHSFFASRYEIIAQIGEGGMSSVYQAEDLMHERDVAIKLLNQQYVTDETAVRRFAREAAAIARIAHPNVVSIYEYGLLPSGQVYIVMELLNGNSLEEELGFYRRLSPQRAISIMLQVCEAIQAAHQGGVIHRDLKPGNIFLVNPMDEHPLVKVVDFGISLLYTAQHSGKDLRITNPNIVVGTPLYLSPEQATGSSGDAASDIYSLGVVFYETLAGNRPFVGATATEVMYKHVTKKPEPLLHRVKVPAMLSELVMRMLEKEAVYRPTIAEIIARLRTLNAQFTA